MSDIEDFTDEHFGLETVYFCVEVRRNPRLEIFGLTHVYDGVLMVVELVAAWFIWQPANDSFQVG